MRLWLLMLVPMLGLALPDGADAQSREKRRAEARRPASVWQVLDQRGAVNRGVRDSDRDSDSDSDRDSDSDSDDRVGGVFDRSSSRRTSDRRGQVSCARVDQQLERAHDQWHRENDRYRGSRGYNEDHERLHQRIDRSRERAGCRGTGARGVGGVLEDIILGPRERDGSGRESTRVPGRLPDGRTPATLQTAASVLDILLGSGHP